MNLEQCTSFEHVKAATNRGQLRMELAEAKQAMLPPEQTTGYAECVQQYEDLIHRMDRAKTGLLNTMGNPTPEVRFAGDDKYERQVSWHSRIRELPSGEKLSLAYEVTANTKGGRLFGSSFVDPGVASIEVKTHVVHTAQERFTGAETYYFTGVRMNEVIFGSDAEVHELSIDDVAPRRFEDITKEVTKEIRDKALMEAVEPWLQGYVDTCAGESQLSDEDILNQLEIWPDAEVKELFRGYMASPEEALSRLISAFDPKHSKSLQRLFNAPVAVELRDTNAAKTFRWLAENAVKIRRAVDSHINQSMLYGFSTLCKARIETEAKKAAEVEELTLSLIRDTQRIIHCGPVTKKPKSPVVA